MTETDGIRLDFSSIPTTSIVFDHALQVLDFTVRARLVFPSLKRGVSLEEVFVTTETLEAVQSMFEEVVGSQREHRTLGTHSATIHMTIPFKDGQTYFSASLEILSAKQSNAQNNTYWLTLHAQGQKHEELSVFIESVPDAMALVDHERRIVEVNDLFCKMFGYDEPNLLGQQIEKLIPDRFRSRHPEFAEDFIHSNESRRLMAKDRRSQLFGLRQDNTEFPLEVTLNRWQQSKKPTVLVSVRDISERLKAQEQFQSMLEMMPDALVMVDPDHRIVLINQKAEQLFEEERARILGRSLYHLISAESKEETQIIMNQFANDTLTGTIAVDAVTFKGRQFPVEIALGSFEMQDRQMTMFTFRDMTQQREFERQMERSTIMAIEANHAKSQFLSNMSHELRTPLNGVLGYAQLLLQDVELSVKQRDNLVSIQQCGEHLLALINDVLDLSKIDSGVVILEPKPFALGTFLSNLSRVIRPKAEAKKLELVFDISDDIPEGVLADSLKLRQVLINLLGNAIKFTTSGSVTLRCFVPKEDVLQFEVRDTGVGISTEEQAGIFKPFQQSSAGLSMGGTGLGLAISTKIVETMGGTLIVASEEGEGSVFTVVIPSIAVPTEQLSEVEEDLGLTTTSWSLPKDKTLRVLVVDDIDTNRKVLNQLLEGAGIETLNAKNGKEALDVITKEHPDFVFMDVRMPILDGLSATQSLRTMEEFQDLPVVAITASVFPESKRKVQEAGCNDIVGKPFRTKEIFETMERYLDVTFKKVSASTPEKLKTQSPPTSQASLVDLGESIKEALEVGDMFQIEVLAKQNVPSPWKRDLLDAVNAFDFEKIEATLNNMIQSND